jgi:hypothetical protein
MSGQQWHRTADIEMSGALGWVFDGIGTALLAALSGTGARFAARRWGARASRRSRITVCTASADSHMADFREHLDEAILAAQHNVYVCGTGFDESPKGVKQALAYTAALRTVLRRGVPVVRVQMTPIITEPWLDQLKELVREFPDLFELWALLEQPSLPPTLMCAIDVDDVKRNVTEFAIQMPRQLGTQHADIASTAVFIKGHPVLARSVRDRITEFTKDPERARRVRTADAVAGFFQGEYFFAYDSYMNQGQATTRLPSAVWIGPVVLHDYKLTFDRTGSFRPGGVANIRPAPGSRVYGVLWRISPGDLHDLDGMQDPRAYSRRPLTTHSLTGKPFSRCHTYSAAPDRNHCDPDIDHLNSLIEAALDVGLPADYIAALESRRPDPAVPDNAAPPGLPPPPAEGAHGHP